MKIYTQKFSATRFRIPAVILKIVGIIFILGFLKVANSQVIINEIIPPSSVEIKNIGSETVNVSSIILCNFPDYQTIGNSTLECGNLDLAPGAILVVNDFVAAAGTGEMGLYTATPYSNPDNIIDYMEWGNSGHQRSGVAATAGLWTEGAFVPAIVDGQSIEYDGEGNEASDWLATDTPTACTENGGEATASNIVINEILPDGTVELLNVSDEMVDVSNLILCNFPDYQTISESTIQCGTACLAPGETVVVNDFVALGSTGEMGIYTATPYSDPANIIDYVEWGNSGHQRSGVAVEAGIWTAGDFVTEIPEGQSLTYDGEGDASSDWSLTAETSICVGENPDYSSIIINEVKANGVVEIKNTGTETIDVSDILLCNFPDYQTIGNSTLMCGNLNMAPGEILVVNDFVAVIETGEMGLYSATPYSDPTNIIDYMEWGNSGHQRSSVAVEAGIWTAGDFAPALTMTQSLEFDGNGNSASDWSVVETGSICAENAAGSAIIIINEIRPDGTVEIKNVGGASMDVSDIILCNFPDYQTIANSTIECGNVILEPGEILVVNDFVAIGETGEMGLYTATPYSDPANIISYMEWGNSGHQRSGVAVEAGVWTDGEFAPSMTAGQSLEYDGEGVGAADWAITDIPSICAENGSGVGAAVIIINEVRPDGTVEIKNIGDASMDVSDIILCNFPDYQTIANSTIECGNVILEPGEIMVVNDFVAIGETGEMGLYTATPYSDPANIISYMEWGSSGHQRSGVAVEAGVWTDGEFAPSMTAGQSLEYDGEGVGAADWSITNIPSICAENGSGVGAAVIIINEVRPDGTVEIKNIGDASMDVSDIILCNFPDYQTIANSTIECGNVILEPGEILVVNDFVAIGETGEMGLYTATPYSDPANIISYMEWGNSGHQRSGVAVEAGVWTDGEFAPAMTAGQSLEYDGEGVGAADWLVVDVPSICEENTGTVGTKDISEIALGDVYPNPTSSVLNLNKLEIGSKIELIDNSGRLMHLSKATSSLEIINVESLVTGLYVLRITNGEQIRIAKIVIN